MVPMGRFYKFEEIDAWSLARKIVNTIYEETSKGRFSRDFDLRSQIRRSAVSVMANIAEGQGRRSNKDFAAFLNISLGSAAETKSHLYIAHDQGYISNEVFAELIESIDRVSKMLLSLSRYLRSHPSEK